jgi:hypothetical protein
VGRVYLETQTRDFRAFGNVWIHRHTIIFKGLHLASRLLFIFFVISSQTFMEPSKVRDMSKGLSKPHRKSGIAKSIHYLYYLHHQ